MIELQVCGKGDLFTYSRSIGLLYFCILVLLFHPLFVSSGETMKTILKPFMMLPLFAFLTYTALTGPALQEQGTRKTQGGYTLASMMRVDIHCSTYLLPSEAPEPEVYIVHFQQGYGEILVRKRTDQGDSMKGNPPRRTTYSADEERTPVAGCFVDGVFVPRVYIARKGDAASII